MLTAPAFEPDELERERSVGSRIRRTSSSTTSSRRTTGPVTLSGARLQGPSSPSPRSHQRSWPATSVSTIPEAR
jgi:hypothetical protein